MEVTARREGGGLALAEAREPGPRKMEAGSGGGDKRRGRTGRIKEEFTVDAVELIRRRWR